MNPQPVRRHLLAVAAALTLGARHAAATPPPPSALNGLDEAQVDWRDVALLDGSTLAARDLARKHVVVELWASWCPFCARQNPHLQKLHEATRGSDLQVLTFTIDQKPADAIAYLKKHGYTFPVAMATATVTTWFGKRRSLPELYVVAPGGRIVQREEGEMFPEDIAALARYAKLRP
jgi:thiol-disulfide isomerase/thioredoxin